MKPTVVYQGECGYESTHFAKVAGVIESTSPNTDIMECNVAFEKGNVPQACAFLYTNAPYWPGGTIFISEVGEGRPIAVKLPSGSIVLTPDNGTITMVIGHYGFEAARLLDEEDFVLAKTAGELAKGKPFEELGKPVVLEDLVLLEMPKATIKEGVAEGAVAMLLKTFGNITFTIGTDEFEDTGIRKGDTVKVTFTRDGKVEWEDTMTYQPSFGYVEEGAPVVFNGSSGYMDIGLNRKNFIKRCLPQILDVNDPGEFKVRIEKVEG